MHGLTALLEYTNTSRRYFKKIACVLIRGIGIEAPQTVSMTCYDLLKISHYNTYLLSQPILQSIIRHKDSTITGDTLA